MIGREAALKEGPGVGVDKELELVSPCGKDSQHQPTLVFNAAYTALKRALPAGGRSWFFSQCSTLRRDSWNAKSGPGTAERLDMDLRKDMVLLK